jgi:hypothetical protein
MPKKITREQIELALRSTGGVVSRAAKGLKVSPSTLRRRIEDDEKLKKLLEQIREESIELAEGVVRNILEKPRHRDHAKVAIFVLQTLGKKLGYSDRRELVGPQPGDSSAGPLRVQIFIPEKEDDDD